MILDRLCKWFAKKPAVVRHDLIVPMVEPGPIKEVPVTTVSDWTEVYAREHDVIQPTALDVKIGGVEITHEGRGDGRPVLGMGTRLRLDGVEVNKVYKITLTIVPDEIVTVEVQRYA